MKRFKFETEEEKRIGALEKENAVLIFNNATKDNEIKNLELQNANILLELATIKGGV